MLILFFFLFQETSLLQPGPINAVALMDAQSNTKKNQQLFDIQIKGPDPYALTLDFRTHTEFLPLFRVKEIKKHPKKVYWFFITLDNKEVLEARIQPLTFTGREGSEHGPKRNIRLRNIVLITFSTSSQMKSCAQCEFEVETNFWYCPRCGGDLDIGSLEDNQVVEDRQKPLIHYRVTSRDQ